MHSTDVMGVTLSFYEACDTPRAVTCAILARYGEWDQLVSLSAPSPPVLWKDSISEFSRSLAATNLLRKSLGLDVKVDPKEAAKRSAMEAEHLCAVTNARIRRVLLDEGPLTLADVKVAAFFHRVRRRIHKVLGKAPCTFDLRLTAGASVSDKFGLTTVPDKISNPTTSMTADFPRACYLDWMQTAWWRCRDALNSANRPRDPKVVRGNRFATVPKKATEARAICKEPTLNAAYQRAVGEEIRGRLRAVGLDLRAGQGIHRLLAMDASRDGLSATVDLRIASDTVCKLLVKFLTPGDWFELLDGLRSKTTTGLYQRELPGPVKLRGGKLLADSVLHCQKFSSMGNGFTFELETLIFWAITYEATLHYGDEPLTGVEVSVYGDDIICPTYAVGGVLSALRWAGFVPSESKTFFTGGFRESCGGDFFEGVPVRSHFLKELPREPQHWISLANGIRRLATQDGSSFGRDNRFWRPWLRCLDALPADIRRLRGPVELGDIVIHDDAWLHLVVDSKNPRTLGWRRLRAYMPVHRTTGWVHWHDEAVIAALLYLNDCRGEPPHLHRHVGPYRDDYDWWERIVDTDYSRGVISRGDVTGYKIGWVSAG